MTKTRWMLLTPPAAQKQISQNLDCTGCLSGKQALTSLALKDLALNKRVGSE
jgi:hypothetical protein